MAMCHKCVDIDKRIARLRDLARSVDDPQTIRSIEILVVEMETRKAALHPEGSPP
jgi:hypothetical protein